MLCAPTRRLEETGRGLPQHAGGRAMTDPTHTRKFGGSAPWPVCFPHKLFCEGMINFAQTPLLAPR
jgi:hypothetical protein